MNVCLSFGTLIKQAFTDSNSISIVNASKDSDCSTTIHVARYISQCSAYIKARS